MSYFRELPNLEYQSFLSDRRSVNDYLLVKNIFRRVKLRDDLQNIFTIFNKYQIPDGSRPELVAEELYGSVQYDWVVLVSAGITRIRDEWPLSDKQIYDYAEEIYGNDLNAIHHYETIEVRDSQDRLILPAGKVVDADFKFKYSENQYTYTNDASLKNYTNVATSNANVGAQTITITGVTNKIYSGDSILNGTNAIRISQVSVNGNITNLVLSSAITSSISSGSTLTFNRSSVIIAPNPVIGISNYEYEVRKNDAKRDIYVLKPRYLQQVILDIRKEMFYDKSSQFVNGRLIRTENTRVVSP
jgi:hypothetical protein